MTPEGPRRVGECEDVADTQRSRCRTLLERDHAALRREPGNAEALYQSAVLHQEKGDYRGSLGLLERLPAPHRSRARVMALECAARVGLGERAAAGQILKQVSASPDVEREDVETILRVASVGGKDPEFEIALLEKLAGMGQASRVELVRLGSLYEGRNRFQEARDTLERAAQSGPLSASLLLDLARVGTRRGVGTESLLARIRSRCGGIDIAVGGGILDIDDVLRFKEQGAAAVLVGSAVHDGRIGRRELERIAPETAQEQ